MALAPLLARYDQLILDLDGCVWVGDDLTPRAREAVEALRGAGKRVAFVTNNSRHAGEDYVTRLWGHGLQASLEDVVTVGGAMQHLLAETQNGRTAFVIGEEPMFRHVEHAGLKLMNGTDLDSRAEVVVVSGAEHLTFEDLKAASLAVRRGAVFLATGRDATYPTSEGMVPGTGAVLAAVETATGQKADIVGKPEPQLFLTALERMGEGRTLVVGDRIDADMVAAERVGLDAALVLTGDATREEGERLDPAPVAIAEDLASLVLQ